MNTTSTWTPEPWALPWDPVSGSLACPGCPDHPVTSEDDRYELVLEGVGLDGSPDHRDALRIVRRAPDFGSGPFEIPALPDGMPAIAVIDYLERQTFETHETHTLLRALGERFPSAIVHVWPVGVDVSHRIAEDAYWDEDSDIFIRAPVVDIAPHEYPMDVGWRADAERVRMSGGEAVDLCRGCLYVEPMSPKLVRYGWKDLPGPDTAPATSVS